MGKLEGCAGKRKGEAWYWVDINAGVYDCVGFGQRLEFRFDLRFKVYRLRLLLRLGLGLGQG